MKSSGRILGVILVMAGALAACSSSPASDGAPNGGDGVAPLMTDGVAPRLTDATAEGADCDGAADAVKDHVQSDKIQRVTVVGRCTLIVIETSLDDGDGATAKQVCESAAEVAYTGDISGIAVKSSTGAELSPGVTGAKCLP
ncbi:hypothetical protein ACQPYK_22945 [Streptosporangium sp. CA-135522]|uniref:hypothetical protein n=1 Tax=Streptosporangium sp. CA-135522 TaxID=3240072 RepID=UPI003D9033DF